jgi:type IV pilus assembly protein PilV
MNRNRSPQHPSRSSGFSLLEVLIATIILGVGLLGMAALTERALRFNHSAYLRSQATNLAYDMADRMRANREAANEGDYDIAIDDSPAQGGGSIAAADLLEWRNTLSTALPSGTGAVVSSGDLVTISIQWNDRREDQAVQQFSMVTSL